MTESTHRLLRGAFVDIADLIALRALPLPIRTNSATASGPHGGSRLARQRGRGVDFAEVRLYQPGDDVRSIDWRVTARKARPHTKIYREERERPTLIVVDQCRSMFFGSRVRLKSVAAAECAALLAWHAVDSGDRVGGLVFDDTTEYPFKPFRSARAVVRFLNQVERSNRALGDLIEAPAPSEPRLSAVIEHLVRVARNGYRVYVISDFAGFTPQAEQQLRRLARHNSIVMVQISDPLEQELPPPDRYTVTDGRTRSVVMTDDTVARTRYHDAFATQTRTLEGACLATHSQFIQLSTNEAAAARLGERLVH
jgi:uncharacterized protein (DUF58 family)